MYMDGLIEKIVAGSQIKYPPQIFEEEKKRVLANFEQNLASQNMDLDTYLKMNQLDKEKFLKEDVKIIFVLLHKVNNVIKNRQGFKMFF